MSARPCIDASMADAHCAAMGQLFVAHDREDAVRADVEAEVRAVFCRAFAGEAVKLPRVVGVNPAREVHTYTVEEALVDAQCEDSSLATRALLNAQLPGADLVFQIGCFREAVIDHYLKEVGDDLVQVRLGRLDYEAAEDRAITRAEASL